MSITENIDLPRIRGDLEKCQQRIAQMEAGTGGIIPETYRHVNAGQAFGNQLKARYADLARLQNEYIFAMIASKKWSCEELILRMESPAAGGRLAGQVERQIGAHLHTARRHVERANHDKAEEHLVAATQLVRGLNRK
jgi:hypothetical protein